MNWNPIKQIPKNIEELERIKKQGPPHTQDKEKIVEHTEMNQKTIDGLKSVLKSFYKS